VASSCTFAAYSGGTYYRDATAIWQSGVGNFGLGVGSVRFWAQSSVSFVDRNLQISFASNPGGNRIPKTNTKRLTLNFRCFFARV
jgi:hypothetical protein